MKRSSVVAVALGAALVCAAPLSIQWSQPKGLWLAVDKAEAVIRRPLTPLSGTGVARRATRRAIRRGYYGYYGAYHPYAYRPYYR